jgi:hypothetical protein
LIAPILGSMIVTLSASHAEPPNELALPTLHAVQAAVSFDATVEVQTANGRGGVLPSSTTALSGAIWGARWYLADREATGGAQHFCCDGDRIWVVDRSTVFVEPLTKQFAIPFAASWLPQMLQVGERLCGAFDPVHGRMNSLGSGVDPVISESEDGERVARFAWSRGSFESEYEYRFRRIEDRWLWCRLEQMGRRRLKDGTIEVQSRSIESMDEPVRVGDALYARRIHSQGWVTDPRKRDGLLEPATAAIGTLQRVEPIEHALFEAEFASLTTLSPGVRVFDRTRPGVLAFTVGEGKVDFDGVGYETTKALAAPPSDVELVELLRSAKRGDARDTQTARTGGGQLLGGDPAVVQASGSTTSSGIVIEPGRRLDLGMVRFGESPAQVTAKFQLRNMGDETRRIKSVQASCGCTKTAVDQKTLAPGATATITTTLTVERAKTYHSSIWVAFEDDGADPSQVEELHIVAVGVPEKAIRATALKKDAAGDVLTIVLYSTDGKPEGDVGVPKGAESTIASDSGWLPVGGDAKTAKHWIRDIVKKP